MVCTYANSAQSARTRASLILLFLFLSSSTTCSVLLLSFSLPFLSLPSSLPFDPCDALSRSLLDEARLDYRHVKYIALASLEKNEVFFGPDEVFLAWVGLPRSPSLWGPSFLVCGARKSLLCNLLHPHNNAPLLERHLQRNFCQFLRYLRTKRSGCGAQKTKFRAPQNRPRSSCKSNFHLHPLFTPPPPPPPPNSFASKTPCVVPALSVIKSENLGLRFSCQVLFARNTSRKWTCF